jgi:hypothetical protein
MLDAGGIGLALLLAAVVALVSRLAWLLRHGRQPYMAWVFAFVGFYVFSNLAESRLWVGNDLLTALFVYVVARINVLIQYARSRALSGPLTVRPVAYREPNRKKKEAVTSTC